MRTTIKDILQDIKTGAFTLLLSILGILICLLIIAFIIGPNLLAQETYNNNFYWLYLIHVVSICWYIGYNLNHIKREAKRYSPKLKIEE